MAHMIDTHRSFLEGQNLDAFPEQTSENPGGRWATHTAYVAGLLDDPQVAARTYDGYFGPATIGDTMAQFYGWDILCHR